MDPLIIIGASSQARVVAHLIVQAGEETIAGLLDDNMAVGRTVACSSVIGTLADLEACVKKFGTTRVFVAIGDNHVRRTRSREILDHVPSVEFAVLIHPAAEVDPTVRIGAGTVIMPGVVLSSDSVIGEGCIVNTGSIVDHDGRIGDFASIAPGSVLGGNVHVGEGSAICLGAKVVHGTRIGSETVVGAGSTVLDDLPDFVVAYGTPAKVVRNRIPGDRYL